MKFILHHYKLIHCVVYAELKTLAEAAVPFIERAASRRGGEDARARTVAFCGNDGLVAYSMIGG